MLKSNRWISRLFTSTYFILGFLQVLFCGSVVLAQNEVVSSEMKRTVILNFKEEKYAAKYSVEIYSTQSEIPAVVESQQPYWEGRLGVGEYKSRFKVIFIDETESQWSDFYNFRVEHYQINLLNLENNLLPLVVHRDGTKKSVLTWAPIGEAVKYRVYYKFLEEYEVDRIAINGYIKKNSLENSPWVALGEAPRSEIEISLPKSGLYEILVVSLDQQGQVIAKANHIIRAIELSHFSPSFIQPKDTFVQSVHWKGLPGFGKFQVELVPAEQGSVEDEWHYSGLIEQNFIVVPNTWPGGKYRLCVSTLVEANIFSPKECLEFDLREGDRSPIAQKIYYQKIQDQRNRLFFHQFELISSVIDYTSLNPSLDSLVNVEGRVMNLSYAKSNPIEDALLNEFYKGNVGFLGIQEDYHLTYDLLYGRQYYNLDFYPLLLKFNFGGGLGQVYQAVTDAKTAQSLELNKVGLLSAFAELVFQYDVRGLFAIDFRLGQKFPLSEIYNSGAASFKGGGVQEASIHGVINRDKSNDRIEFGYLYKKESYYFEKQKEGLPNSSVDQTGHYLSIGYTMETK